MVRPKFAPKSSPSRGPIYKPHYLPLPWTCLTYDAKWHPDPICCFSTMHWTDRWTDRSRESLTTIGCCATRATWPNNRKYTLLRQWTKCDHIEDGYIRQENHHSDQLSYPSTLGTGPLSIQQTLIFIHQQLSSIIVTVIMARDWAWISFQKGERDVKRHQGVGCDTGVSLPRYFQRFPVKMLHFGALSYVMEQSLSAICTLYIGVNIRAGNNWFASIW